MSWVKWQLMIFSEYVAHGEKTAHWLLLLGVASNAQNQNSGRFEKLHPELTLFV